MMSCHHDAYSCQFMKRMSFSSASSVAGNLKLKRPRVGFCGEKPGDGNNEASEAS